MVIYIDRWKTRNTPILRIDLPCKESRLRDRSYLGIVGDILVGKGGWKTAWVVRCPLGRPVGVNGCLSSHRTWYGSSDRGTRPSIFSIYSFIMD